MATEDFTTWTSDTASGQITVAASSITWNSFKGNDDFNDAASVYKDFGAGYFSGDFTHRMKFTTPASGESSNGTFGYFWYLSNAVNEPFDVDAGGGDFHSAFFYVTAAGNPMFYLRICEDGSLSDDYTAVDGSDLSWETTYYIDIIRDDDAGANSTGQLTFYISTGNYYGESGTSLVKTLTLDCDAGEQNDFRYLFATVPHGVTSNNTIKGTLEDLDIGEVSLTGSTSISITSSGSVSKEIKFSSSASLEIATIGYLGGPISLDGSSSLTITSTGRMRRAIIRNLTQANLHIITACDNRIFYS